MLKNRTRKSAFTLIELLVVIAIVSLLVSILMPSLRQAKLLAKRAACLSNHHNLIVALNLYASDFSGTLPTLVDGNANNSSVFAHKLFAEFSSHNGRPSGLGLLYKSVDGSETGYVSESQLFYCPATEAEPSATFPYWSFCSYYYRFMAPEGSSSVKLEDAGNKAVLADVFGTQAISASLGYDSDDYYYHNEAFPHSFLDGSAQLYFDDDRFIRDAVHTWGRDSAIFVHNVWLKFDNR